MKFIVTIVASKSEPDTRLYSYNREVDVSPRKDQVYLAIQEYLGSNNFKVEELSVKDQSDEK